MWMGAVFSAFSFFSCYWEKLSSPYQFPATITGVWALRAGGLEKTLSSSYHNDPREMPKRWKRGDRPQGCPCRIGLPDLPDHFPVVLVLTAQAGRIHPNTKPGILSGRPGGLSSWASIRAGRTPYPSALLCTSPAEGLYGSENGDFFRPDFSIEGTFSVFSHGHFRTFRTLVRERDVECTTIRGMCVSVFVEVYESTKKSIYYIYIILGIRGFYIGIKDFRRW